MYVGGGGGWGGLDAWRWGVCVSIEEVCRWVLPGACTVLRFHSLRPFAGEAFAVFRLACVRLENLIPPPPPKSFCRPWTGFG